MRSVRFAHASDGTALAWARSGTGPPLVKASNWLTHLEHDDQSPVWSHWVAFLEGAFDYLRYDERGCGLSDRDPGKLSLDIAVDDLERVIAASDLPRPFTLLGISQGAATAIAYAARHPGDVAQLILWGGYARGAHHRDDPEAAALHDGIAEVFRAGWNLPNPAFREVFTRRFVPDGDEAMIGWFNDLVQRATTPQAGAALLRARADVNVTHLLADLTVPTFVFHAENDAVVPVAEGALLGRGIAGAEFQILPSANHILQRDEPAWEAFTTRLRDIAGAVPHAGRHGLTDREQEILTLICAAKDNKSIARELGVSEKTVRNHATRIFAKLGVRTRQEAIVKMARQA